MTVLFSLLNIIYVGLGILGGWRLWRGYTAVRPALMVLGLFVLLRTVFLTTVETPEPRYVLECFPVVMVLAACYFTTWLVPGGGLILKTSAGRGVL